MYMTKRYKSTLVVWNNGENPVIETFYADTLDELQNMQGQWMDRNGYQEAKVHQYELKDGVWQTLRKGDFRCMPHLPEFAFLCCSPHEGKDVQQLMQGTVLQVNTGRILRFIDGDAGGGETVINSEITVGNNRDNKDMYKLGVVRLTERDLKIMETGQMDVFKKHLADELFIPFVKWFTNFKLNM